MTVASVGTPTLARASAGSITAAWGSGQGRTAGDLLVAVVTSTGTTSTATLSTPSGWTKALEVANTTTAQVRVGLYTKVAAGVDTAPAFTSTISGTATMSCTMFELSGASGIDTSGTYASGATSGTLSAMTATTTANVNHSGEFAIAAFAQERTASTNTWNVGTGWTNAATDGTSSITGHSAVDYQSSPAANAALSEAGHWTTNTTAFGAGLVVVFAATSPAVSTLVDSLMGGSLNSSLWTSFNSGNFSWANSELSISNVVSSSTYSGLTSAATYSLAGSAMYVQLVNAGNQSLASWQCAIALNQNSINAIQFIVGGNNLVAQSYVAGTYTSLASVAYNASTMKWLRIREASGTTYFDYSADASTWTTLYSGADFITVTSLVVTVECGTYASETSSTTGIWQDFNTTAGAPVSLTNNLEGGTNGTTISTANSGGISGNAFDVVTVGTGTTVAYSTTHAAHGGVAMAVATGSTATAALCRWSTSLGTQTTLYGRAYLYLSALPVAQDTVVSFKNSGTAACAIQINTSGNLVIHNAVDATVHTSTNAIPPGQWVRIEWSVTFSATVGAITLSYYAPMDSTTAVETYTSAATQNFGPSCNMTSFGWTTGNANQPLLYFDDLGVSTSGLFGPVTTSSGGSSGGALVSNNFEGGTNGTTISTANSGGTSGTAFSAVTIGATATAVFSNTQAAHGNLALAVTTGTTSSTSYVQWGSAAVGTLTTVYGRAYFYATAAPGTSDAIIEFQNAGTFVCGIQMTTGLQWLIQDAAFGAVHTFTNTIPTGQWVRIEWKIVFSATVGQVTLNYYSTKDSTAAIETYTSAATQNFGASANAVGFGWNNAHVSQPTTYIDDLALSTTGFLGPAVTIPSGTFMTFFA